MRKIRLSSKSRVFATPARRPAAALPLSLALPLALFVGVSVGGLPAAAEAMQCAAHDQVIERLADSYAEKPVSIGVTETGSLLEVLASPAGTWTIVVTVPGGPTCLVSSGDGWHGAPIRVSADPGV